MSAATRLALDAMESSALLGMPWSGALLYALAGVLLGCAGGALLARRTRLGGPHCAQCGHRLDDRRIDQAAAARDEHRARCPECGASCTKLPAPRWAEGAGGVGMAHRTGAALAIALALGGVVAGVQWPVQIDGLRAAPTIHDAELDALVDRVVRWHLPSKEVATLDAEFTAADTARRRRIIERLTAHFGELHDAGWELATRHWCSRFLNRLVETESFSDDRNGVAPWRESQLDESFLDLVKTFTSRPQVTFGLAGTVAVDGAPAIGIEPVYAPSFRSLWTAFTLESIFVDGEAVELTVPTRRRRLPPKHATVFQVPSAPSEVEDRMITLTWRRTIFHEPINSSPGTAAPVVSESDLVTEHRLRVGPTGILTEQTTDDRRHVGWTAESDRWSLNFIESRAHQVVELTISPVWLTDATVCGQWHLEQDGRSALLGEMVLNLSMSPSLPRRVAALVEPRFDPDRPMTLHFRSAAPSLAHDAHAFHPGPLQYPSWEGTVTVPVKPGVSGPTVTVERVRTPVTARPPRSHVTTASDRAAQLADEPMRAGERGPSVSATTIHVTPNHARIAGY